MGKLREFYKQDTPRGIWNLQIGDNIVILIQCILTFLVTNIWFSFSKRIYWKSFKLLLLTPKNESVGVVTMKNLREFYKHDTPRAIWNLQLGHNIITLIQCILTFLATIIWLAFSEEFVGKVSSDLYYLALLSLWKKFISLGSVHWFWVTKWKLLTFLFWVIWQRHFTT